MAYSEKLKSPLWQRKRLEVMQRDNFKCSCCSNDKIQLQVHHIEYFESLEPWEYPNDMLVTLCEPCHSKELIRFKYENKLLQSLKTNGFLADDILALSCIIDTKRSFTDSIKKLVKKFKEQTYAWKEGV